MLKNKRGITLIALVVTIIVLLILAGISIQMITGQSGILKQAQEARQKTAEAEAEERQRLEEYEKLFPDSEEEGTDAELPLTVKEAKQSGAVFSKAAQIVDEHNNIVTVPRTFHVSKESGDTVQQGVVIEDKEGNQFVWIPVSNIDGSGSNLITKDDGTQVEITLGRYEFDTKITEDGIIGTEEATLKQKGIDYKQETKITCYAEEDSYESFEKPNTTIEEFVNSVKDNRGYYLARYEASFASGSDPGLYNFDDIASGKNIEIMTDQKPASKETELFNGEEYEQMTYTPGKLWKYIFEKDAEKVCNNMYKDISGVESHLTNSYAFDTAIVYIRQMGYPDYGNDAMSEEAQQWIENSVKYTDEVCKINYLASNIGEITTETSDGLISGEIGTFYAAVSRGLFGGLPISLRLEAGYQVVFSGLFGFRPIVYIK